MFESRYVAQNRITTLCSMLDSEPDIPSTDRYRDEGVAVLPEEVRPLPVFKLDDNIAVATKKLQMINDMCSRLPGKDCGSCGSPSCRSLAEDIVLGYATELDCIFLMREKVRYLAEEMVDLASKEKTEE